MSGGFLGRWSQRKLSEKQKEEAAGSASDSPDRDENAPESDLRDTAPQDEKQEFSAALQHDEILSEEELAALPSIDSITSETDLRQFLRKGVPNALKNAAMRKMWLLDPAIRNHADLAVDYAWDWNVPGGVPGHGGLMSGESVARMLDKVLPRQVSHEKTIAAESSDPATGEGGVPMEPESVAENTQPQGDRPIADEEVQNSTVPPTAEDAGSALNKASDADFGAPSSVAAAGDGDVVSRNGDDGNLRRRRHGGALPS